MKKSEKYKEQRLEIIQKLEDIIGLDDKNSFILYDIDNDTDKQQKILELVPEIKKYFYCNIHGLRTTSKCKRSWLSVVKYVTKDKYELFTGDHSIKLENGKFYHTRRYFFREKDLSPE